MFGYNGMLGVLVSALLSAKKNELGRQEFLDNYQTICVNVWLETELGSKY